MRRLRTDNPAARRLSRRSAWPVRSARWTLSRATPGLLCAAVLCLEGCGQRWVFAPPARSLPRAIAVAEPSPPSPPPHLASEPPLPPTESDRPWEAARLASHATPVDPRPPLARLPEVPGRAPAGATWGPPVVDFAMPQTDRPPVASPSQSGDLVAEEPSPTGEPARPGPPWSRPRLGGLWQETWQDVRGDYRNYYTWPVACGLLYGVAGGSILANTSLDQDFRDWYQDDVRSGGTDDFASFWKAFGEGQIFIPAWAGLAVAGRMLSDVPVCGTVGEFGMRTTRGYLVGTPPMLFMQYCLGGSRPGESDHESMWRPFEDSNGVSGHAFVGAVPFLTAARMCDRKLARAGFYLLSTFPAWSRVNDDSHYLSQACLGWWMAYLACESVDRTETSGGGFTVVPIAEPGTVGAMAIWRR